MIAVCKEAEARMECNKSERSGVSKTENRSSIVTNSVKTLKMAHITKKKKKKILKEKGKQAKISVNILMYISTPGVSWVHLCVLE